MRTNLNILVCTAFNTSLNQHTTTNEKISCYHYTHILLFSKLYWGFVFVFFKIWHQNPSKEIRNQISFESCKKNVWNLMIGSKSIDYVTVKASLLGEKKSSGLVIWSLSCTSYKEQNTSHWIEGKSDLIAMWLM